MITREIKNYLIEFNKKITKKEIKNLKKILKKITIKEVY